MVSVDRASAGGSAQLLALGGGAMGLAAVVSRRVRPPAIRSVISLLALDMAINAPMARRILLQAAQASHEREAEQRKLEQAQLAYRYSEHHQVFSHARRELLALLAEDLPGGRWRDSATAATSRLVRIGDEMRQTRAMRDALLDADGRLPVIGGHAARVTLGPDEQMSFSGVLEALRRQLPWAGRRVLHQIRLILEEVRLLHNAEIEVAVLRFTLISRAVLVGLAPWLGGLAFSRVPFHGTSTPADVVWGLSTLVSAVTAWRSQTVVAVAMTDSADARRFRSRLLAVEVPLSLVGLVLCPAWPVAVFASGWTNWWQRQTEGLQFDWTKLLAFVLAVAGLQQVGLLIEHVAAPAAAGETALTLGAILVLGASYGAMLPLTVATIFNVIADDGGRQLRSSFTARDELLRCASELRATADTLLGLANLFTAANPAASTARQAAQALESAADRAGRRTRMASQVLGELVNEAAVRSFLVRRDTAAHAEALRRADAAGMAPPTHIGGRTFDPTTLRYARIRQAGTAKRMRAVIECALNEANVHGTGAVRVLVSSHANRLTVIIANQPKPVEQRRPGLGGEGVSELARLARRLPDGHLDEEPGLAPAAIAGLPGQAQWWVVRFSCAASVLQSGGVGMTFRVFVVEDQVEESEVRDAFDRDARRPELLGARLELCGMSADYEDARDVLDALVDSDEVPDALLLDNYILDGNDAAGRGLHILRWLASRCYAASVELPRTVLWTSFDSPNDVYAFCALGGLQFVEKRDARGRQIPVDAIWSALAGHRWRPFPYPRDDQLRSPTFRAALPYLDRDLTDSEIAAKIGCRVAALKNFVGDVGKAPGGPGPTSPDYPRNRRAALRLLQRNGWVWVPYASLDLVAGGPLPHTIDPDVHADDLEPLPDVPAALVSRA